MTTYTPLQLLQLPPTILEANPIPTSLTVDPFSDLLWVGSSSGLVSALCSPTSLTRNVQFPAHGAQGVGGYMGRASSMAVKEIRLTDREVWTLTDGGVGGRKRGGAVKWSVSDPTRSLASMAPNPANSNEVVAGGNGLMVANTNSGQIVRRVSVCIISQADRRWTSPAQSCIWQHRSGASSRRRCRVRYRYWTPELDSVLGAAPHKLTLAV